MASQILAWMRRSMSVVGAQTGRDADVWSGRALQVDFAELAVSGLASMYPASDWSVLCSGPSWISARCDLISGHAANRTSAVVRAVPEFHRGDVGKPIH
jgi:hypothetical protein